MTARIGPGIAVVLAVASFALPCSLKAQGSSSPQDPQGFLRDFSKGPSLLHAYSAQPVPVLQLQNSPRLRDLIHDGQLEISVADALSLAIENNLDIGVQRYARPLAQADVLKARAGQGLLNSTGGGGGGGAVSVAPSGSFDPSVNVNFSWDRVEAPLNNTVVEGTPLSISYATALNANYSQLFPTGTNYTFGITAIRRSSNTTSLFNPSASTGFTLGLNQPILSGFGKLPYMRQLLIAQNNGRNSEEVFRQQLVTTVVAVENAYWDLVSFRESVKVAQQSLGVSQKLLEDNRKQAEIGTLAPLDVVSAESEVAGRQRDLIVAQTNLQLQETRIKNLLSKQSDSQLDAAQVTPTDQMPEPRDVDIPDLQEALVAARNNRPDIRQAEVGLQNQNITVEYTDRNLLPNSSVFALLNGAGLKGECTSVIAGVQTCPNGIVAGGFASSLGQTFGLDFPEYGAGFNLNVPIRNRAGQADNLSAQLTQNQLELGLQRSRNTASLEVRQAIIGLMQGKAQVQAAHEAARLASQTLEAEQKKLAAGVSTPYQVILRERDFVDAQQAEVGTIAGYAKALVEMDRSMGTTLDRNGILFEDAAAGTVSKQPTPPFNVRGFSTQPEGAR